MKTERTSAVTAWILAAVLVFSGAAEMRTAVLCVGDDGHTDVEILASFCCAEGESSLAADPAPSLTAADNQCGDCVDLILEAQYVNASKSGLHFECVSCLCGFGADLGSDHPTRSARGDFPVRKNFPTAHSSVVLLI